MAQGRKTGGRQKGIPKTGGRVAGVPNKAKELRVAAMAQAVIDRELSEDDIAMITPLDALLYVMRRRLIAHDWPGAIQAAACAAPYMHARLSVSDIRMHHAVTTRSDE